ncbi:LuxR family transcriptional regulator [Streptomyces sp. NPDC051907]|uniref:LuxR family transcriptional regulator n=1 Tax=Streptomyces sp. NPDC051907 TaxID=3155284 RepID=UPI00343B4EC2
MALLVASERGAAMAERITGAEQATGQVTDRVTRQVTGRTWDAVAREAWADVYAALRDLDPGRMAPDELVALADAAWWTRRVEESVEARTRAYAGFAAAGDERQAGFCAWMLFYEYSLAGRTAAAAGWLHRARAHLSGEPECVEQCYLVWVEAQEAQQRGDFDESLRSARRMGDIARRCGSQDLLAMSVQAQANVLLAQGRVAAGLTLLDDAMCSAMAGELSSLFTGWIYCLGLQQCMGCADLRRAVEWTDAAMSWCASMPRENNFRGLCRVHRAEVLDLCGDWPRAAAEAALSSDELLPYEARTAAEAFYLAGELQRRRGDLAAAETSYDRAHELGRDPQPGLALLRLAQGKADSCAAALRIALAAGRGGQEPGLLGRCRLLAAQVEVALALGRLEEARTAAQELESSARAWERQRESKRTVLHASAGAACGAVAFAERDLDI